MYEYTFRIDYVDGTFSIESVQAENVATAMNLVEVGLTRNTGSPTDVAWTPVFVGLRDLEPQDCLIF